MTLLQYCQTAQRMGSSRDLALRIYRQSGEQISARRFARVWSVARDVERLFTPEGGVRRANG